MRNLSKKERLLESVKGLHKDTLDILQMDVTSQQSILEATARIVEKRIDVLGKAKEFLREKCSLCLSIVGFCVFSVCNAGVGLMGPLEVQSLESMRRVLEVNLLGTIQTIQAFLPNMKARGKGHILVTGSAGGLHGETDESSFLYAFERNTKCFFFFSCLKLPKHRGLVQVFPLTRFTVPANLQWRERVRVWPSFCNTSTSSQYFLFNYCSFLL